MSPLAPRADLPASGIAFLAFVQDRNLLIRQLDQAADLARDMFPDDPSEARSIARSMRRVLLMKLKALYALPEARLPGIPRYPSWCGFCLKSIIFTAPMTLTDTQGRPAFRTEPCGHTVYGLVDDMDALQSWYRHILREDKYPPPACDAPTIYEISDASLDWLDTVAADHDLTWDDSLRPWLALRDAERERTS